MFNILDLESCSWFDDYCLEIFVIKFSLFVDLFIVGEFKFLVFKRYGY